MFHIPYKMTGERIIASDKILLSYYSIATYIKFVYKIQLETNKTRTLFAKYNSDRRFVNFGNPRIT